jgi:copper resistance protein C
MLPPSPARAHAIIVSAAPAPGADAPRRQPAGRCCALTAASISSGRTLILVRPDADVRNLAARARREPRQPRRRGNRACPGRYRLRWQVLAIGGHITRGDTCGRRAQSLAPVLPFEHNRVGGGGDYLGRVHVPHDAAGVEADQRAGPAATPEIAGARGTPTSPSPSPSMRPISRTCRSDAALRVAHGSGRG